MARTLLIVGVFVLAVSAASLRTDVSGITYAHGSLTLKIDSTASYNGVAWLSGSWDLKNLVPGVDRFFNFDDIKPGDQGENTISMHVGDTPSWLCIDFKNLKDVEGTINEPESHEDINGTISGELAEGMEFFSWRESDGDNIFEIGEKPLFGTTTQSAAIVLNETTYPIADYTTGGACPANSTCYIGVYWCAGNLEVNLTTAVITCDPTTIGNEAQTDSMSVDVIIRAQSAKENPKFTCTGKGGQGCTPGYWKQSQHFGSWTAPYTPSTLFSSVFDNAFPGKTLLQVLSMNGGGLNALGRHTVAALLNTTNGNVDYLYTTADVISMFNTTYPGSSSKYETLKNKFEGENERGCPLGRDE